MAPSSQELEPPGKPGRFTSHEKQTSPTIPWEARPRGDAGHRPAPKLKKRAPRSGFPQKLCFRNRLNEKAAEQSCDCSAALV
ncbi:hypothetical protein GFL09_08405 [Pseudomonas stutzeri]|nr:hypothetical protein [Stutzerimonas stutzeri]